MSSLIRVANGALALLLASGIALPLMSLAQAPPVAQAAPAAADKPAAPQLSPKEKALLDAELKRFDAQVAHDVAALNLAIADEAIYVHANGDMQTKAEYLHAVDTGASRYRSIETFDRSVRLFGKYGITHGIITLNVGVDRKIVARYTGLHEWRDDRWQVISFQTTPITARQ
jgi:hypothetical protein